jgi:ribosomal-protein-alanine acetyltransferase
MTTIRRGGAGDFEEIAVIQSQCPEAAQWDVADYGLYELWVALSGNRVSGFLVARPLGTGEYELLNLAVAPDCRRQGIARELVSTLKKGCQSLVFLEVRESNLAARKLYKSMGFKEIAARPEYYHSPSEAAIVMKFHSC